MSERDTKIQAQKLKASKIAIWSFVLAIISTVIIISPFIVTAVDKHFKLPSWFITFFKYFVLSLVIILPFSVLLGIVSIFKIKKSKSQLKGIRLAIGAILINIILAVTIFTVVIVSVRPAINQMFHVRNLEGLGKVLLIYASDNNDKYPTADKWCDLLLQGDYGFNKRLFQCPANRKEECGYAINPNAEPNSPPDMVVLFETKGGWNQYGGPELLNAGHHWGKGCNILFNDCHVKFVEPKDFGKLKWEVKKSK